MAAASIADRQVVVPQSAFLSPQMCLSHFYRELVSNEIAVEGVQPAGNTVLVTLKFPVADGDEVAVLEIAGECGEADEPLGFAELTAVLDAKTSEMADLTTRLSQLEATIAALQAALTG